MREAKLLTGIAMLLCNVLFAQTDLSGKISDSKDGTPIVNATVKIRGGAATVTDAEGFFTLHNIVAGVTLEISSIGYLSKTVKTNQSRQLLITLEYDPKYICPPARCIHQYAQHRQNFSDRK